VNGAEGSMEKAVKRDEAHTRREPVAPNELLQAIVYYTLRFFAWVLGLTLFRFRIWGRRNIPLKTGAILASNHQSYLDPIIVGAMCRRKANYLARESLWRKGSGFFRFVINFFGAVPISIDTLGKDGIRLAVAYLKKKRHILVFPEGTRTRDGSIGPMSPGVKLIAEMANVPIVPTAVKGAFEMWPRDGRWTKIGPVSAGFGKPFEPEELRKMSNEEFRKRLRERVIKVYERLP